MFQATRQSGSQKTTSHHVVVPFYAYAALSLLAACLLLVSHTGIFMKHHFHPHTLAITHLMALGWGTMMMLGAGHQLLPVLIEGPPVGERLARWTFYLTGAGIPLLVAGFYYFQTGWVLQAGAILVNLGVACFLSNVLGCIWEKGRPDVHAASMAAASLWLFSTTFLGLLLILNFTRPILPSDSLAYLSLHAHMGIVGWFLLLVTGVAGRLIPMFLISKYAAPRSLWWVFACINAGMITFIIAHALDAPEAFYATPALLTGASLVMFGHFCYRAWKARIRKSVDDQMKVSLLSVCLMAVPLISLPAGFLLLPGEQQSADARLYGFTIFFGWITAIILGMTFKTLPFIIWNKVYGHAVGKTPVPKDLFRNSLFKWTAVAYLTGYILVVAGILLAQEWLLKGGTISLLAAAILYACNSGITIMHRPRS